MHLIMDQVRKKLVDDGEKDKIIQKVNGSYQIQSPFSQDEILLACYSNIT